MIEQSAFLQAHVIGDTPVRHWVISLPPPLRNLLGFDGWLTTKILGTFIAAISRHYLLKAREALGSRDVQILGPGFVTAIHRASSRLLPALHFHSLGTNGVFVLDRETGVVSFLDLPAPTPAEIGDVAWGTCKRVVRMLRREEMWTDLPRELDDPERLIRGTIDLRSRKRKVRFNASASRHHVAPQAVRGVGTFDVWVGDHVKRGDHAKLGRTLQYILAPPILDHQLVREPDGRITFTLKKSRRDGTRKITFTPFRFILALIGLIPEPHFRLIRLHGVYGRRAKYRDQVVPQLAEPESTEPTESDETTEDHRAWAELLHRAYEVDVVRCRCSGRLMLITLESDRLIYRRERDRGPPGVRVLPPAA